MYDDSPTIRHGSLRQGRQFLDTTTVLPVPIGEAFEFFSNAENLERITPPELGFRILTPTPIPMRDGTIIDYRLRLFGVPFGWRTRISEWRPNAGFIDEQLRGPYAIWRHEHAFAECADGTRMTDRVEYRLPFQPAGLVALPLVRRQLDRIFRYRANTIRRLLGNEDSD